MTTNQQLYSKFHHKLQKISYDIDNFIEKLSNSIEDLDAKPKNYKTQFRSQEPRLHWEMNMKKDVIEILKKIVVIRKYSKEPKCAKNNIWNNENLNQAHEKNTKTRSLEFSLSCFNNELEVYQLNDEEVSKKP